jgi:chromosome segregation ATPase
MLKKKITLGLFLTLFMHHHLISIDFFWCVKMPFTYAFSVFAFFRKKFGVVSREDLARSETKWEESNKTTFESLTKNHETSFANFNNQIQALRQNNEEVTKHLLDAKKSQEDKQQTLDQLMLNLASRVSTDFEELQKQFKDGEVAVKQEMNDLKLALDLQKNEIESVFQNLQQTLVQTSEHMKEFANEENKKLLEIYQSFSNSLDVQKKNIEEKINEFAEQQKILETKAENLEKHVTFVEKKVNSLSEQNEQDAKLIQEIMNQREENKKRLQNLQNELEDLNQDLLKVLSGLGKKTFKNSQIDFSASNAVVSNTNYQPLSFNIDSAKKYPPLFRASSTFGQLRQNSGTSHTNKNILLIESKKND